MKHSKVTKEYREKISRRMKEVWAARRERRIQHCNMPAHCSHSWSRKCICLCAECAKAKAADH